MGINLIKDKTEIEVRIRSAIKKNIAELTRCIERCSVGELYYFVSGIHLHAMKRFWAGDNISRDDEMLYLKRMDNYRYLASMMAKEGVFELSDVSVDENLIKELVETTKIINAKHESIILVFLLENVELDISTNKLTNNLSEFAQNELLGKINDYSVRIQAEVETQHRLTEYGLNVDSFIEEFSEYNDLFLEVYEISLIEFRIFIDQLVDWIGNRFDSIFQSFSLDSEEIIDINDHLNYLKYIQVITFSQAELLSLNSRIQKSLALLTLDTHSFDSTQLKYDMLSEKPIIKIASNYIINIELLIGALRDNVHYALLKNKKVCQAYKARMSKNFVQRIAVAAASYNYREIGRDSMLYEGKQQIGDLDLILRNQTNGTYLFIEAKYHSLTTGVQSHDPRAIKERLQENNEWQSKVNRRLEKLISQLPEGTKFRYVIVTKKPEPMSHFSNLLAFSFDEFKTWLELNEPQDFAEVFKYLYPRRNLTQGALRELNPISTFVKENSRK